MNIKSILDSKLFQEKHKIISATFICFLFIALASFSILGGCGTSNNNSNIDKSLLPAEKESNSINVNFNGEHATCDAPSTIQKNQELNLHLNIEYFRDPNTDWKEFPDPKSKNPALQEGQLTVPIIEYEVELENIHVYIGGKEYRDAFTFMYQNNEINELIIKKEYALNDIDIYVKATPRKSTLTLYGFLLEGDFKEQYKAGIVTAEFKTPYQNHGMQLIRTLSEGEAFSVYEDDDIDVTFTTTDPQGLPKNLWFRTNSKYCTKDKDFTIEYSQDFKSVHVYVPHYIVTDHCSIQPKEQ